MGQHAEHATPGVGLVCIGEALMDLTEVTPGPGAAGLYQSHPGGSPFNVAVGAARLGVPTAFLGSLGGDALGRRLRGFLEENGVDTSAARVGTAPTPVSIMSLKAGEPSYSFYGSPASLCDLRVQDVPEALVRAAGVVHAGSIGLLHRPAHEAAVRAFETAPGRTTFDPNVRPGLVADRAEFLSRTERLMALADVVKLSAEDAEYLYPDLDREGVARRVLGLGAVAVVLTRASQGVQAWTPDGVVTVPTAGLAPAVDTTGGGDSVMAAIVSRLVGLPELPGPDGWDDVLRFAMRVAASTCSRSGGAEAMPRADEVAVAS
ncbi:carbohydrate kinase [Kineococcus gynurae]|uniref:Carbohydrate kinase n=1 Tax=Kineococcus gynurae TaxID=452979 RepID=A0ABV5LW86_9ACTN